MKQQTFDYDQTQETDGQQAVTSWDDDLDAETRAFVQQKTDEIHGQMKRTAEGIIWIGQNLLVVKERLRHGQFLPWLKAEFAMSENAALKFMQVAERFGSKSINFMNLSASVLYELAAPSTKDEVVEKVLTGQIEASLSAIKEEKEALKRKVAESERARANLLSQLEQMQEEVTVLQRQLEKQPQVIENPETEAALVRLREQYAQKAEQLRIKTERVAVLSAELEKHAHRDEQETYRQQIRVKWRRACEAFHQGIKEGLARMVTPLDAGSAFEGDDWARLAEVLTSFKRVEEELSRLQEKGQYVEAKGWDV